MSFDNQGKPARGLPFPLKNPQDYSFVDAEGAITHQTPDIFPVDNDEKIDIVLNLSLNEFVAIASSIDIGSDIAYGSERNLVWWTWVRSFIGTAANMSCEDIADCVESELETNQSLVNALTQNSIINGFGNANHVNGDITTVLDRNPPLSLQETVNPDFECNLDKLWGGIRHGIVERLDDTARDLLEDLAAINDLPQRFQAFIDVIPVLGDLAEGIVTLATEVIPDILNLYNSFSSEEQLDEIACDIFALVCSECRYPTFEELYNYYSTLGYEMDAMDAQTLAPLVQKIGTMIGAFQPASIVYHSMITFQLFTLYLQAEWNGHAGIGAIIKFAHIGEDFGSNNWLDICESCNEPYAKKVWNVTQTQGDTNITGGFFLGGQGRHIAGSGWVMLPYDADTSVGVLRIGLNFNPSWVIRAVGFKFANQSAGDGALTNVEVRPTRATNAGAGGLAMSWGTTGWTYYTNIIAITGYQEIAIAYSAYMSTNRMLTHIAVIFDSNNAPSDAIPTSDPALSGTVFP